MHQNFQNPPQLPNTLQRSLLFSLSSPSFASNYNPPFLISQPSFNFQKSIWKMQNFLVQNVHLKNPFSNFSPRNHFLLNKHKLVTFSHSHFHPFSQETQIQKSIICARNKKRQYGSARSRKLMIESAYYIASKLKILPEPLDYLIKEFGIGVGGNGGGGFGTFWKGSGWGGFDGWGRKRRRKKLMLEIMGILVILCLGFWLILGKQLDADVLFGFLGLVLFGFSMNGWRNGIKDWALGFCCCAFLVGLVLRREDFQRWAKSFGPRRLSRWRKGRLF